MGAEMSNASNISISDKQLIERLRNDTALFQGKLNNKTIVSVFEDICSSKENPFEGYTLHRPLSNLIRNLKIYRHPYSIVKFLGSIGDKLVATEVVIGSLEKHLKKQSDIEICLGLKNILNALIFLIESAHQRHLNLTTESIFITENNTWKLNGMEHVFPACDITKEFLQKSRQYRSQPSIDPDEESDLGIEQFAFGVLCQTVIKKDSKVPHAQDFLEYCQSHLKHKNPNMRPLLSAIQLHNYFMHDFVVIHNFLSELSLKTQPVKQEFFKTLVEKLKQFDEATVGSQLSELLLSRLVLIDVSAQYYFIPYLLKPQNLEDDEETSVDEGLFSTPAFVKYIIPKLKQVFKVLDVQIRLILLEHFPAYVNAFTREELIEDILPQLLLGIKDTNDLLVTKTLIGLSCLIPILGASQVIGSNRKKLFADGRPQQTETWNADQPRSITPVINNSYDLFLSSSPVNTSVNELLESNRDGMQRNSVSRADEDEEEWSWDNEEQKETSPEIEESPEKVLPVGEDAPESASIEQKVFEARAKIIEMNKTRTTVNDNIDELDIKNQKLSKLKNDEVDFFSDFGMSPDINPTVVTAEVPSEEKEDSKLVNRLQMSMSEVEAADDGWGDDEEWNEESSVS